MREKNLFIVRFSILLAIEIIFCFTPIGSIPIGPIVATLAMIPVILTAIILGTKAGTLMGAFTGLFSFIVWTFMPPNPLVAFVFSPFYSLGEVGGNFGSIIICFLPRILTGLFAGLIYNKISKSSSKDSYKSLIISSVAGSLINTIGVLGGISLFFGNQYATALGQSLIIIVGISILTNGIPEAIVSALLIPAIARPVIKMLNKKII